MSNVTQDQTPGPSEASVKLSDELQSAADSAIEDADARIEDAISTLEGLHDELADCDDNYEAENLVDQISIILDDLNKARERISRCARRGRIAQEIGKEDET